jgi:hypothetical protein
MQRAARGYDAAAAQARGTVTQCAAQHTLQRSTPAAQLMRHAARTPRADARTPRRAAAQP